MFEDRFRSVFSKVEIELASSYPVCDGKREIIFFYSTRSNDEVSYCITEIKSAFSRDIVSGSISEIPLDGELSELSEKCRDDVIRPEVMDDEAFDLEDDFFDLYEEYYDGIEQNYQDPEKKAEISEILNRLIPESNLKNLYRYFCPDLF